LASGTTTMGYRNRSQRVISSSGCSFGSSVSSLSPSSSLSSIVSSSVWFRCDSRSYRRAYSATAVVRNDSNSLTNADETANSKIRNIGISAHIDRYAILYVPFCFHIVQSLSLTHEKSSLLPVSFVPCTHIITSQL
jgi:hypothetical protein